MKLVNHSNIQSQWQPEIIKTSSHPTIRPSNQPSTRPPDHPNIQPSIHPAIQPSSHPAIYPSNHTTIQPSNHSTIQPSNYPTIQPSSHLQASSYSCPADRGRCSSLTYITREQRRAGVDCLARHGDFPRQTQAAKLGCSPTCMSGFISAGLRNT